MSRKGIRILFISNLYPPHDLGGMELRCREVVGTLRARGHVCQVLTGRFGVAEGDADEEGVTRSLHLEADVYHYSPLGFFVRRPWREHANARSILAAVAGLQPDVIFVWGMWNLSRQVAYWAEQCLPGRVAYAIAGYWLTEQDVHESFWQEPGRRGWVRALMSPVRWLALRTLARERRTHPLQLAHVACVSEFVRQKLTGAGALPHGARVIYNGIDPGPYVQAAARRGPSDGTLRLVYTGGLVEHKGVHTAIEALGFLRQRQEAESLHLTLIGGGHPDYEAALRRRAAALGVEGELTFHGRVPREQIAGLLADHDVFLFTSVYAEPIARSVMEAMASGLAVIGTAVGGQAEMLEDGVNALVFPPDDAEALGRCIVRLQGNPALRSGLAEAGRRTVLERFTLDRMIDEMEEWLKGIVG